MLRQRCQGASLSAHRLPSTPPPLQLRAVSLSEQPLTSVALLPAAGAGEQPLCLCGGFDASVHAYSPTTGRQLGSFQAAGDAVSCLQVLPGAGRLLTAAWDGSLKLWDLREGRPPWEAGFAPPAAHVAAPSGVWAAAASSDGQLVLAGAR